jgi:hypothetical protein
MQRPLQQLKLESSRLFVSMSIFRYQITQAVAVLSTLTFFSDFDSCNAASGSDLPLCLY